MARFLAFSCLLLLLAACAGPMRAPEAASRAAVRQFAIDARFALHLKSPQEENFAGRLSWKHDSDGDHLFFADPLGQGVAELVSTPDGARLKTANGREKSAPDGEQLLQEVLGYRLPVRELPTWLLGRPKDGADLRLDARGRPELLMQDGWRIEYAYEDQSAQALPSRLVVVRPNELELRLRIEEWRLE